jgi:hypothetical protein
VGGIDRFQGIHFVKEEVKKLGMKDDNVNWRLSEGGREGL